MIARAIAQQTFNRKYLVMVPNCNWTGYECDLLAVTENLRLIDVEIKISRADLRADAKKDKWWRRRSVGLPHVVEDTNESGRVIRRRHVYAEHFEIREWPAKVWKHYYAMPREIWTDTLFDELGSPASGVLLLDRDPAGGVTVRVARSATPNRDAEKISPAAAMDIARLASLRMWEAYAAMQPGTTPASKTEGGSEL
ncbi:hypothetical protein N5K27_22670 [Pigmentiphaga sp. GD03639]|uniref:hypothetical protein n=1 Tax=Pigmentiphaga sp. GD03639 TaxID=2975354 RepID=UPI00244D52EF|nr:hypothetical protein [Pigmentiphaga sp. GD03639]MDH2239117.1 hypothetical protein [Pigmentiphaga sp. GD03639]